MYLLQEGRTVLFVSHNMGAIAQLTSKCFVLANGQIVFRGEDLRGLLTSTLAQETRIHRKPSFDVEFEPRKYLGTQSARIVNLRFEKSCSTIFF